MHVKKKEGGGGNLNECNVLVLYPPKQALPVEWVRRIQGTTKHTRYLIFAFQAYLPYMVIEKNCT